MREGWEYRKLGDLCKVLNGLWTGKREPFVNIAVIRNTNFSKDCKLNLDNVAYIDVEKKQFETRKLLVGDIIIEKSGGSDKQPVGRPILFNIPDGDYSFSNFTATLRLTDNRIFPKFLHLCLYEHYRNGETKRMQSKTTGLHNLDMKAYLRLPIPCFDIAEQERIVSELDLLSSIIEKEKAQLEEYNQLAQSIFYDMFGDPVTNERGWEVKKLGEVSKIGTGATPSREKEELYYGGDIHWVKTTEVHNCEITNTEETITQLAIEETNCKIYPPNTLLMAMYGQGKTRGQIAKLKINAATNQACAAIILDEKVCNLDFIYSLLLIKYEDIRAMAQGGNQANLNMKLVGSIPAIIPSLDLQQQFASKIKSIEHQKSLIKQSITEVETLFNSRMDYYFN